MAVGSLRRYFGCYYDDEFRFLGTDANENWKVGERLNTLSLISMGHQRGHTGQSMDRERLIYVKIDCLRLLMSCLNQRAFCAQHAALAP